MRAIGLKKRKANFFKDNYRGLTLVNGAGSPSSGQTKKSHPYYVGEVVFNGLNSTNCSDPQSVYERY